jgi:3-deoxy-manno-octulosonate cytidylyltransferase (CMP-KDO synthetase)
MQATRLPGKPLADIGGVAMIVHVWRRAAEAAVGEVVVATDAPEIAAVIKDEGGRAVMTSSEHQSGSDRVHEAVLALENDGPADFVINLQGDLPLLDPELVRACIRPLELGPADIATLAAEIVDNDERNDPNVVKVAGAPGPSQDILRALYFSRAAIPHGDGALYHHIGLYAFRRAALEQFVSMPQSELEKREKLEQLRALEAGMRIDVALVDTVPLGVDTPADLERACAILDRL